MKLTKTSMDLTVVFDDGEFEGRTVVFKGERLINRRFLAYADSICQVVPVEKELSEEEQVKMIKAIEKYCETSETKIEFED